MTKHCKRCGQPKAVREFSNNKRSSDGIDRYCKQCKSTMDRSWRERNLEYKGRSDKNFLLKKRFGITLDEFERLFQAQKGLCAICAQPETQMSKHGTVQTLAANKDASTGKVRGLLCAACRFGLVKFHFDVGILRNAIAYLARFS